MVMISPKFCEHGFDFVVVIRSQFRFLDLFLQVFPVDILVEAFVFSLD